MRVGCGRLLTEWKITPGAPSYCLVDSSPRLLRGSSEYAYLTRKLYYWSQHYIIGIDTVNRTPPGWRIYQRVKTSPFSNCEKKNRKYWNIDAHQMLPLCVRNFRIPRRTELTQADTSQKEVVVMPRCWKFPEPSRHFLFSLRLIYKENFDPQKSDERNEGGIFCCGMRGNYILIIVNLQQWNCFNHGGVLPMMSYFLYGLLVFAIMFVPFETVLEPAVSICIWFLIKFR